MEPKLTLDEIRKRYDGEYVLIADPELDDQLEVIRGRVIYHNSDPNVFDRESLRHPAGHVAVRFMGEPDPEMEFILNW